MIQTWLLFLGKHAPTSGTSGNLWNHTLEFSSKYNKKICLCQLGQIPLCLSEQKQPWYCRVWKKQPQNAIFFVVLNYRQNPKPFTSSLFNQTRPFVAVGFFAYLFIYLFICNCPETAGNRIIWPISLSHFPQQCEIQVRRYAGHTGGNGADLIE